MAVILENVTCKSLKSLDQHDKNTDQLERDKVPELRMDGGLTAWMQVLGSWILFANTWFV